MIQALAGNEKVPSVVVGVGSDVPQTTQPQRFRQKYRGKGPYAVGRGPNRIENKGCRERFNHFSILIACG